MLITDKQKETLWNKYIKRYVQNGGNPMCSICRKKIESVEESEYVKTKKRNGNMDS